MEVYKLKGTYTHTATATKGRTVLSHNLRERGSQPGWSQGGELRGAPLAGAVPAQDKGGGVALFAHAGLPRPRAPPVAGGATEDALHELVEEVAREEHVDPGVAAAVEAGQEHGDDESRGCRRWGCREKENRASGLEC